MYFIFLFSSRRRHTIYIGDWSSDLCSSDLRASGYEIEPIYGIAAQRFVEAVQGRGLADVERDMAAGARHLSGGRPSLLQDVQIGRAARRERVAEYGACVCSSKDQR